MILHIDMDAFYASVEKLDNPELIDKCVIVGGQSSRSVVSAACYNARKLGVRSAMPVYQAKKLCPDGVFIFPRMARYKELSRIIMAELKTFSPVVEPVSIDEAYLDISGCEKLLGTPVEIAAKIKKRILESVNLACSIGIAPSKVLAKIASDLDKPDGFVLIKPDEAEEFIKNLLIKKVPGVGTKTGKQLELLGIVTLGDVRKYPEVTLLKKLGKFGQRLIDLAAGIDRSTVRPPVSHKSVSTETTLSKDTGNKRLLKKILLSQAVEVAEDLRRKKVKAKTITVKIKHSDFKLITRRTTMERPTHSSEIIYKEAVKLLNNYRFTKGVRLIGVGASGFISLSIPVQMDLFGKKQNKKWEKVDRALDTISEKFGKNAVKRAAVSNKKKG